MNQTEPRQGKAEVELMERKFEKDPKPSTETKRQFDEQSGVDLVWINVCSSK